MRRTGTRAATLGIGGSERLVVGPNGCKLAEAPPCGRKGSGQMDVGTFVFASELKVLIDVVENLVC